MSFSKPADNGVLMEMELNNYMELLKTVHAYSMAIQMCNNYRDLGTTPKNPLNNCQDDIL